MCGRSPEAPPAQDAAKAAPAENAPDAALAAKEEELAQREKEEELVFRGEQYAHAIGLFQRRTANSYPPNLDVLVQQKLLRKKYKDPITDDDFVPIAL